MQNLTVDQIAQFQKLIYDFYNKNRRNFPWREAITPYKILVSEIMLQQTQTARVVPKFEQWLTSFPDFATLAQALLRDVLVCWQGLGYNRRGKALHDIAIIVQQHYGGILPNDPLVLETFPGITRDRRKTCGIYRGLSAL